MQQVLDCIEKNCKVFDFRFFRGDVANG